MADIRREALFQLQSEDEKYSSFLDNRVVEGVEMSFFFLQRVCGAAEAVVQV